MAKEYLSLKGFSFVEKNVSGDAGLQKELRALGFDRTPVVVIGDHIIDGFDAPAIDRALQNLPG